MAINQRELANLLGLSQYTVSVALGRKGRINEETRQRVLAAAEKYGYRANKLAAGLRASSTRTIGIIWDFIDPWAGDAIIALALLKKLQARGYTIYQSQNSDDPEVLYHHIDDMLSRNVDALLVQSAPPQLLYSKTLQRLVSSPPLIAVTREDIPSFPGDLVIHDRYQAIDAIARHLAETGRKRPAMALSMAYESNPPKYHAFVEACERYGIQEHDKMLLNLSPPTSPEHQGQRLAKAIDKYFKDDVDVDAIFCFNDLAALTAIRKLKDRGLSVPEDVAVIGFNNTEYGQIWDPPLATGDRKVNEVADLVEKMLLERLKTPSIEPQRHVIHMEFIPRQSGG